MWLRKQCLTLAAQNATPVSFWLSLPLPELPRWIDAHNEIVKEQQARVREMRRNNR